MKRGTSEHPKVRRFARALGVGLAQAVGHLELMWHFTAKFAPAGDLGRFADADIEEACAWEGDGGKMVAALTASGWLDAHPQHRVIVHDWSEHADDSTNLSLARAGRLFCDGKRPKTARLTQAERAAAEAKLTEAESVRTASARRAHGKRTAGRPPSPPLPSPPIEEEKNPSGSSSSCAEPPDPTALKFAEDFRAALVRIHPGFKPPTPTAFATWTQQARLLIAERGLEHARETARWLFDAGTPNPDAEFWRGVILSVPKFRQKFDQLAAKRQQPIRLPLQSRAERNAEITQQAALRLMAEERR